MSVKFLSDEWFAAQEDAKNAVEGLAMNEKLAALVANLLIKVDDGNKGALMAPATSKPTPTQKNFYRKA